jgi:phage-related protein (TIGR01555 family)
MTNCHASTRNRAESSFTVGKLCHFGALVYATPMRKPRAPRHVTRASDALARTTVPLGEDGAASEYLAPTERLDRLAGRAAGVDGLINVIAGLGTRRDKRTGSSYCRMVMHRFDLDETYSASGLAGRIIDLPVGDMMRTGWTRTWDGVDKDQASVKSVETAEKNLGLRESITEAMTWGRLYGGAVIVMILRGENLLTPLNLNSIRKGALQNLQVLDRYRVTPSGKIDKDLSSPNFGKPLTYRVAESSVEIHWSRVVVFGGRLTPYFVKQHGFNQGWDDSILQRVIETVKGFDAAEAAAATMVYEATVDVHYMDRLREELAKPNGEDLIEKRLMVAQQSKGVWKTLVLDGGKDGVGGDKWERREMTFTGVEKVMDRLALSVAVSAGMPITTLFGESPGGLQSTGEHSQQNWDDAIDAMRDTYLCPRLDRIDDVLIRSVLGKMPTNYVRTFNPLRQMDPEQQAKIANMWAQTDKIYYDMGAITAAGVARENKARGTYRTQEDSDIKMIESMEKELEANPTPVKVPPGNQEPVEPAA